MSNVRCRWFAAAALVLITVTGSSATHAGKIYWSGILLDPPSTGMFRVNLDGTSVEVVVHDSTTGLAIDPEARKVYWGQYGSGGQGTTLRRANLDGSDPEVLYDLEGAVPDAIALDLQDGSAYLSANYLSECEGIRRYRMDGTGDAESIVPDVCAIGVAVDAGAGKLYWAERSPNQAVRRANLDGSAPEIVIEFQAPDYPEALALDAARGKLYWSGDGVHRAGTDGSNVEAVVPSDASPWGIALDLQADKLYWYSPIVPGTLNRADLDGSNPETILDELDAFGQIAIDPVPDGTDVPAVSLPGLVALALLVLVLSTAAIRRRGLARGESH